MEQVQRLKGMTDLTGVSWRHFQKIQEALRDFLGSYGYGTIDTPVLEATELFLRKSGGELATRMYSFRDPGGNLVSLRPEYTASIMRHYIENGDDGPLPLRVQYCGPIFRYDSETTGQGSYRQYTQLGAELLGSSSPKADVEILAAACLSLSSLGIRGYTLGLGDLGVPYHLLENLGLSDRAVLFILESISELKSGAEGLECTRTGAQQRGLLADESNHEYLRGAVRGTSQQEAQQLLLGVLQGIDPDGLGLGQRQPREVVERLERKLRGEDAPERFLQGLELVSQLAQIRGEPRSALKEAERVIRSFGLDPSVLEKPRRIAELLRLDQLKDLSIVLDFGLARGLAYYNGIVFEILHPAAPIPLGGGGRYDGLARALSSPVDVPALGFALNLELVSQVLESSGKKQSNHSTAKNLALVVAADDDGYQEALRVARELRAQKVAVEMEVCERDMSGSIAYAKSRGIGRIVKVDSSGKVSEQRVQDG